MLNELATETVELAIPESLKGGVCLDSLVGIKPGLGLPYAFSGLVLQALNFYFQDICRGQEGYLYIHPCICRPPSYFSYLSDQCRKW